MKKLSKASVEVSGVPQVQVPCPELTLLPLPLVTSLQPASSHRRPGLQGQREVDVEAARAGQEMLRGSRSIAQDSAMLLSASLSLSLTRTATGRNPGPGNSHVTFRG